MTGALLPGAFFPGVLMVALLAAAAALAFTDRARVRKRFLNRRRSWSGTDGAEVPGGGDGADKPEGSRSTRQGLRDTAMMLELVAAMLDAGSGIGRSLELVAASASTEYGRSLRPVVSALAIGADWETAWRSSEVRSPEILALRDALGFAALTGAPSSAILYAQAARMRRERFRAAEKRAASLGVKLVIPLGLCSLPAFICLGVVPVLLALIPAGA
ncbi:type II secretion system F family protein [Micrococcaceae bacterium Sec5.7]